MKLIRVEEIPEINYNNAGFLHDLVGLVEEFVASDMKYARVALDPGEYGSVESARMSLVQTCERKRYPVGVRFRAGNLYLFKKGI